MTRTRAVVIVVVLCFSLSATGGAQPSVELSGTISSTRVLTSDAVLVGDVTCQVAAAACIRIGAPGVTLRLNGFSITGRAAPDVGCNGASTNTEHGIHVPGQRAVDIRGPGIVGQFRGAGIRIDGGSTRVLVRQVTLSTNCTSGIWVVGGGDNDFEANTASRNGNLTLNCGGI